MNTPFIVNFLLGRQLSLGLLDDDGFGASILAHGVLDSHRTVIQLRVVILLDGGSCRARLMVDQSC